MAIAACSGGPGGNTNEPVGVVNAAIAAAESGGFAKLAEFSCAANKDDFTSAFGGGDLGDLAGTGINPDELFDAMKIDFQDVTVIRDQQVRVRGDRPHQRQDGDDHSTKRRCARS